MCLRTETTQANCDPSTEWFNHDTCESWNQPSYPDPAINEEWWGLVRVDDTDPNARGARAAQGVVADTWRPGAVCNMSVDSYDATTGATTISFDPAPGSTDHTVYYGPLNTVSSYGYTGSVTSIGADGTGSLTLSDPGSLFWLVVGRTNSSEGYYGTGLAERPASPGAAVPQDANRTALCSTP